MCQPSRDADLKTGAVEKQALLLTDVCVTDKRQPDIRRFPEPHSSESLRRNTDDRGRIAIDSYRSADDIGALEKVLPRMVTDYRHKLWCRRTILHFPEPAPSGQLNTERFKVVARDQAAIHCMASIVMVEGKATPRLGHEHRPQRGAL